MELKKLHQSFYLDNPIVNQALDFDMDRQEWNVVSQDKVRGHGIIQIELNNLIFGVPVRSNIKHNACFILEIKRDTERFVKGMGLDYSKSLLIHKISHISDENFILRSKQAGKKLIGKHQHITKQFEKYVNRYIFAIRCNDENILNQPEYRFSTLVNYHQELGLVQLSF